MERVPSATTPALKSIHPFFFVAKGVFVAIFIVGAGAPKGVQNTFKNMFAQLFGVEKALDAILGKEVIKGKKAIQVVENTRSFVRAFSEALQALVNKAIENSTYLVQASFTECSRKLIEQIKDECRSTEDLQPFLGLLSVFDRDLFLPAPPHVTVKCDYEITTETVMQTRIIENNDDTVKRVWNWLSQKWCDEAAFVKEVRYK